MTYFDRILQAVEGDVGTAHELVRVFMSQSIELVSQLGGAVESGNSDTVERIGHKLRGTLRVLGAHRVCEELSELERRVKQDESLLTQQLLLQIETQVSAIRRQLGEDERSAVK